MNSFIKRMTAKNITSMITTVFISVVIFVAFSVPAFADTDNVENVQAVSSYFKTITVTWDEIKIEKPQEETEPTEEIAPT